MALKGYCSVDKAMTICQFPPNEAVKADVELHLELAEDLVEQYCHTRFDWEPGVVRSYSGSNSNIIAFGYFLRTLTKVEFISPDGVAHELDDCILKPDSPRRGAYRWLERANVADGANLVIQTNPFPNLAFDPFQFQVGQANFRITGDWGWQADEMPAPIVFATAYTVKYLLDDRAIIEQLAIESGGGRMQQNAEHKDASKFLPLTARAYLADFINSRVLG